MAKETKKEQELRAKATGLIEKAQAEGRELTEDEEREFNACQEGIVQARRIAEEMEERLKGLSVKVVRGADSGAPKFSLLRAISAVVNHETMDATTANLCAAGREQMNRSGVSASGQIILPIARTEERALDGVILGGTAYQSNTHNGGKEAVATETWDIITALRGALTLTRAGAQWIDGLVGNVDIPTYSGTTVGWGTEVASASNGTGTFGKISLTPKRLTAYIDVSKQFLAQTSPTAEALLKEDLVNALACALEKALLATSNTSNAPAAIASSASHITTAANWYSVVAALEGANMYGDFNAILNPSLKASLRGVEVGGSGSGRLLFDYGELDGYPTHITTNAGSGLGFIGRFQELVIGQWGAADITVDPYTRATNGEVRITLNAYLDAALRRAGSVVAFDYVAPTT